MAEGAEARDGNRRRFAETARDERPDLALLCLLIGVEAALEATGTTGALGALDARGRADATGDGPEGSEGSEDSDGSDECQAFQHGIDEAQIELDRLAGQLPFAPSRTPRQWADALAGLLGGTYGFRGTQGDYRRLESSLLQSVLRRRRGLPILLSVVWLEVARRAGAPVYGVALPGHFVIGFGEPAGEHVIADPYEGGRALADGDMELLVARVTGTPRTVSRASLQPAGAREIVLRILNNIRAWASARPEQSGVQLWALELSLLLPHHPARLRFERAQLLVERGDFSGGAAELEAYAEVIAPMEPTAADATRRAARAARARLN